MTSQARQVLIALAFCGVIGCRSGPPATEGPAAVSDRRQNEEGKMREWLGRGIGELPADRSSGLRQVPTPVTPDPHPSRP